MRPTRRLTTMLVVAGLSAWGLACSRQTRQSAPVVDAAIHAAAAPASSAVAVGQSAPDFTLPSTEGRAIGLSESRGRQTVVVAFFPRAFTPG